MRDLLREAILIRPVTALFSGILLLWLAVPDGGRAAESPARQTAVSIQGQAFHINGRPTYEGRSWRGHTIEGLLNGGIRSGRKREFFHLLDDESHRARGVGMKGFIALQLHKNDRLRIAFKDILIRPVPH